eukprot:m.145146 g.145146  ORF g.145146 m.145146 type:complete len:315 (-) comp14114_c0_seq1:4347-5291(-)
MARGPGDAAGPADGLTLGLSQQQVWIVAMGFILFGIAAVVGFMSRKKSFLKGTGEYAACPLIEKEDISHDVRRFRFRLPTDDHVLGLPIGKHVFARAKVNGETVIRSYTPVTDDDTKGYFDLVLKIYSPAPPRFPDGGIMSQHLDSLNLGDTVDFCGPTGHVSYAGKGTFVCEHKKGREVSLEYRRPAKRIGMIAGGTGITPMLQVMRHILNKEEGNDIEMWVLLANKTVDDILLQKELEAVDPKLHLWYTLDTPPKGWGYSEGFISEEMLRDHMPPPSPTTQILMCGPPPMIKFACVPNLEKLGFTEDMMIKF